MANFNLELPSFSDIDDQKQRKQIKDYLYSLNEQLRYALSHIDTDNFTDDVKNAINSTQTISDTFGRAIEGLSESGAIMKTEISQNADQIIILAQNGATMQSSIEQNAAQIILKVAKDGVISAINQSAEQIQIQAGKINLEGAVSISSDGLHYTKIENGVINTNVIMVKNEGSLVDYSGMGPGYLQVTSGNVTVSISNGNMSCQTINGGVPITDTNRNSNGYTYNPAYHEHTNLFNGAYQVYISSGGNFASDSGKDLGSSGAKWGTVYLSSAPVVSSDANAKHDIADIGEVYRQIVLRCRPVQYKYNNGTSGRFHTGFIAQDIELLLAELGITTQDFAGLIKSPIYAVVDEHGEYDTTSEITGYIYSLRYEEFISPAISVIQAQQNEIDSMKKELAQIKDILARNNIV